MKPISRSTVALLLTLLSAACYGQGMIIVDRILPPHPPRPITQPLQVLSQKVDIEVRDFAATITVEQSFRNQYGGQVEGTFLYPLPAGAAVSDFGMTVNGEMVGGELLDADKARTIYEDIVRRQRDPGLLEYIDSASFRARIFPIASGETKRVKLEYTQALQADSGLARLVLPLKVRAMRQAVGPWPMPHPGPWRPGPFLPDPMLDRDSAESARRPAPPGTPPPNNDDDNDGSIGSLVITVNIESKIGIKSVYSPTHQVELKREGDHQVRVSYESAGERPQHDFVLYYQLSDADFGLSLLPYRGAGDDLGAFMMLIAPKSEALAREIEAKDIVFVVDTSGSMAGNKMEQVKRALAYGVKSLRDTDRFNVLAFSTAVNAFENGLVDATPAQREKAAEFVGELPARGGTNIADALQTALDQLPKVRDAARPAMVVFLTDGQPTVGETRVPRILEGVERANAGDARMFVFGVGDDVNAELLDRMSNENHGTRTYVRPAEDVEEPVSALFDKVSSPVLSNLKLTIDGVKTEDLQPSRLSDLFRGSQLTVLGRYRGAGDATVTLTGEGAGGTQTFTYPVSFPERDRTNSFVPRLWATRKVGYLLEQIRFNGESKELKDEVVALATRYGILTPYTSFLVLEPGMSVDGLQAGLQRRLREDFGALQGRTGGAGGPMYDSSPGMGGMAAGAPEAPRSTAMKSQAGAEAVDRATHDQRLQEANQVQITGQSQQQVGARTFYQVDEYWVESTYQTDADDAPTLHVQWGSDGWFELARLRPELAEALAVGEKVKTQLGTLRVVVDDGGQTTLTDQDRARVRG